MASRRGPRSPATAGGYTDGTPGSPPGTASPSKQRGIYTDFSFAPDVDSSSGPAAKSSSAKPVPSALTFKAARRPRAAHAAAEEDTRRKAESKTGDGGGGGGGAGRSSKAALEPKVFVQHSRKKGSTEPPRRVEVERKKRYFASQDISELLAEEGVNFDELRRDAATAGGASGGGFVTELPIEAFDNADFEVRSSSEWIALGNAAADKESVGVPGKGLREATGGGVWADCRAVDFNADTGMFTIEWADGSGAAEVPRLFLLFDAEDPFNFAARVAAAFAARRAAEKLLRYNLYVDCMPTDDTPVLDPEQVNRVLASTMSTRALKGATVEASALLTEVNIDYARTMNKIIFDLNLEQMSSAEDGAKMVFDMPERDAPPPPPQFGVIRIPPHNFVDHFSSFAFNSFLTKLEAVHAVVKVRTECNRLMQLTTRAPGGLLHSNISKTGRIDEFEHTQNTSIQTFTAMLGESWTVSIKNHIVSSLKDVGKGWFNLQETNREVYEFSKLYKFLRVVNFMMQDTLRYYVTEALHAYTAFIERACLADVKIKSPSDVALSYPPDMAEGAARARPLFSAAIGLSHETRTRMKKFVVKGRGDDDDTEEEKEVEYDHLGFEWSVSPEGHVEAPLNIFDKALSSLAGITQVERLVMSRLFWPHEPVLETVHSSEPWVLECRERIETALRRAVIAPLNDYMATFDQHLEFLRMDVDDFMEGIARANEEKFNVASIMAASDKHLKLAKVVEDSIPMEVNLGLFEVKCGEPRKYLADKHLDISARLRKFVATHAADAGAKVSEGFAELKTQLSRFPKNIEELCEIKEFMATVPEKVKELEASATSISAELEALDGVNYKTEPETIRMRWTVFGWPKQIAEKMAEVGELLSQEQTRHLQSMKDEQVSFDEGLDQLFNEVARFAQYKDIEQLEQINKHVARVKKQIADAKDKSMLFNAREGLFGEEITEYEKLSKISKTFEPYQTLWETVNTWVTGHAAWMNDAFTTLNAEEMEKVHGNAMKNMHRSVKSFEKLGIQGCIDVAAAVKKQVDEFAPVIPLVIALRNPGMRDRHWDELSAVLKFELKPDDNFTLTNALELKLLDHLDAITKVGERAGKEYQIEVALNKMEGEWDAVDMVIDPYRETGSYILKGVDDLLTLLDEHVTMTQAMSFSAFKKPFAEHIDKWGATLNTVSEVLEEWIKVQRSWLYLQPIFDSADIQRQLPTEYKRFTTVDKNWRTTMSGAHAKPKAIKFCDNESLLKKFQESNKFLDLVQKGLSDYLETKRAAFARFYFLSNDELLEILSQTKDPRAVQPHLKKCFEGMRKVNFKDDGGIDMMISGEGERVKFNEDVVPGKKNVEVWMTELEDSMRVAVRRVYHEGTQDYFEVPRTDWIQRWPGQIVLNSSQLHWTKEIEDGVKAKGNAGVVECYEQQLRQLQDMVTLVRDPNLTKLARISLGALCVIDVHAREVTKKLADNGVKTIRDFDWISQMRYYWEGDYEGDGNLWVMMVSSKRPYGYEYLGNSWRLVITPLTDKCYLTLMGALQMTLGGAPAGPAGTGKTETVKDLAKALAKQCVVFNCSDGLDFLAMGKFFKGLASCGAWACFDEFNRIDVEVLSVVAQQIMTLQFAVRAGTEMIFFEDSNIRVDSQFAVYITMNPGYAGRTELPDNLKALFRPVAMMVPDYALIGEIMLFSFGFQKALSCAQKMVATFKLCSEQLSSQDHYDYGMRAVKTVITAAGNLKRADPDMDEEVLLLRALQDVNLPKFLAHDLPLFNGIMSDLFPGLKRPAIDYGALMSALRYCTVNRGLQPVPLFLTKCIQLYETVVVRHGLMCVGPTGGGKTSITYTLQDALTLLHKSGIKGNKYQKVHIPTMNPKAITMGQLYGEFDANTHEWQDGILADTIRLCAKSESEELYWVDFDGPVDALWIENMNTVLDDNKKLCLVSGEIIALTDQMNIIFEVEDLAVASPATVSRCGMVYTEPTSLGLDPLVQSWIERLPETVPEQIKAELQRLIDTYVAGCLYLLRRSLSEPVPTVDNNLASSLMRLVDTFLEPFKLVEGRDPPTDEAIHALGQNIEAIFMFCLVWSVAATSDAEGRARFDAHLRQEMANNGFSKPFPPTGRLYDYKFDTETGEWIAWMKTIDEYVYNPKLTFSELIIPTKDTVRYKYLAEILISQSMNVLMTGPTGTGKTVNVSELLSSGMPKEYIPVMITFSAQTSANQTQDTVDSKLEKRARGVYGPVAGSKYVLFVDDLNMPQRETYFAQPPIELLRQWCDHKGWYDRKERVFRQVIDTILVGAMGPPGGGRNPITPRFLRHFNIINYSDMDDESMFVIFHTILSNFMGNFDEAVRPMAEPLTWASINVYLTLVRELLPTPVKPHYTFNLRDLGKVFQGMLMSDYRKVPDPPAMGRLWLHECLRVFSDRLTNDKDRAWFEGKVRGQVEDKLGPYGDWAAVRGTQERVIYGDFMIMGADPRIYEEVVDASQLQPTVEEYLQDYNAESKTPMNLVMFMDAIGHVSRISRVIRQPQGNALLMGVGGSGRQSLARLATFMADYDLFQIEIAKGYGKNEWREDVKTCLLGAGIEEKATVFLFTDSQIVFDGMLEDINNILNTGDVPNLYAPEDMETIMNTCRRDCMAKRIQPTKINIFAQYILRVRRNIHVVFCMSPMSEAFRDRLRMFPSLVNCCTIDWFSEWPDDALKSVAMASLTEQDLKLGEHTEAIVEFFRTVHQGVARTSEDYWEQLRRRNYVTPTSYLELLSTFKNVLQQKRKEVGELRNRLQIGLDKLISTASQVAALQEELTAMEPQLVATQKEVEEMLVVITKDKASAAETKQQVEAEESVASRLAEETKAIADDAQRDLDEALPALDAAVACLNKLKKSDIDEVRAMKKPPKGVVLTMHAACVMFEIKPVMKKDEENLGKKIKDYWEAAQKSILTDANKLLRDLKEYDKDNIKEKVIEEIAPFMDNPEFTVAQVDKSSKACSGICMWVLAMYKYYTVAREVEPKKKKLAEAQALLDETMAKLNDAKARLKAVEDRLADLEAQLAKANAKKEQLAFDVEQCRSRLTRAQQLIGGLGGERDRWTSSVAKLTEDYTNLTGDSLVSSSTIAYLGAFTTEFRKKLIGAWDAFLEERKVPHTPGCDLLSTLGNPVEIRAWQIAGLPTDDSSVENGIIISKARRWPLMIDPQGQANRFIKNMGKNPEVSESGMEVIRQSEKNFLRSLENGVRFGKWILLENLSEYLDAALEPILLQQKFKQGGTEMIRLGDSTIAYNDSFRFFMTTTLPNPHYPPEVAVKVSLLNFTITPSGLEDQMLGVFVVNELPEMEERKATLVMANARMKKELQDIESKILYMLSNSKGNILDDVELIETLSASKKTSAEIEVKVKEAEETEAEIDSTRESYRPVAYRASILYFTITELALVDPMYQYSLPWFVSLFVKAIEQSEQSPDVDKRIPILNDYFTYLMYRNVCRSLFERHKLMLSFLMTVKILGPEVVDPVEWRFLISGQSPGLTELANPAEDWITGLVWTEICHLDSIAALKGIAEHVRDNLDEWRSYFDDPNPQDKELGARWKSCTPLQRMLILRCFRPDKITMSIQTFVTEYMGKRFIEPPPFDLAACFDDSSVITPLVFVLTAGSDPTKAFYNFADSIGMMNRTKGISLGQGQGKKAAALIEEAQKNGGWVMLQNCHLCASWMDDLERIVESIDPDQVSKDFRLWLTSMPTKIFPVSVLQNGIKMTNEPPKGLRQNLKNFYFTLDEEKLNATNKPALYQKLIFGLAFFHANIQERIKFGPLGWNVPYEFNGSDLEISRRQLELFLNEYDDVPYQVLNFLTSYINYGGRVTDAIDLRTIDVILLDYFCAPAMKAGYKFSPSGLYRTIDADPENVHASYVEYLDTLPINPDPEVFGMHPNANITCDQNETLMILDTILSLQPRSSGGAGMSRDDLIMETAKQIKSTLPPSFDVEEISMRYPVVYEESMNTVLVQECIRYNKLLVVMHKTLVEIQKAIKGLVVMSGELEDMGDAMSKQRVPGMWEAKCYPSLKPLAAWTTELMARLKFIGDWVEDGIPASFWISGFYFPQAFLTGTLQNYARKHTKAIDTLSYSFNMLKYTGNATEKRPEEGCIIYGLFLEGAQWDTDKGCIVDSTPKKLYTEMPCMHLVPEENRAMPTDYVYRCPVYKILSRAGTLSTTGHSTNFVFWIELKSDIKAITNNIGLKDTDKWIKAGVAAFCSLRY